MKKFFAFWVANSVALYIGSILLPSISAGLLANILLAGLALALVNLLIRPVLLIISFPINILTLGLFTLLINTWMVMLADFFVPGFYIEGFWPTFAAALLVMVAGWGAKKLFEVNSTQT